VVDQTGIFSAIPAVAWYTYLVPSVASPSQQSQQESNGLDLNFQLRLVINQSLGAVQGRQTAEAFAAITYEELASQQIERITGAGTTTRPNELERVNKIESDMLNAVQQIRNIPPESFLLNDPSRDVNTPVDPDSA
jgi:hypothetical protein